VYLPTEPYTYNISVCFSKEHTHVVQNKLNLVIEEIWENRERGGGQPVGNRVSICLNAGEGDPH
jgi:hypothetical protein